MNRSLPVHLITLVIFSLLCGCSGGNYSSPVTPDEIPAQVIQTQTVCTSDTLLWGYYELYFDFEKASVDAVANRSAEFTVNIVKFLNNTPGGLAVAFNGTTPGTGYIDIDLAVTIKHPLNDAKFDGYDVRGIFISEGTGTLAYNPDLKYPI